MSAKNPVGDNDKATAVVADDWEDTLKRVGGSQSDDWNHVLGNQAIQSLWIKQSDNEVRARQYNAVPSACSSSARRSSASFPMTPRSAHCTVWLASAKRVRLSLVPRATFCSLP